MKSASSVDRPFLIIVSLLVCGGLFLFFSASLGLFARGGAGFEKIVANHLLLGFTLGSIAAVFVSRISYKKWSQLATPFFIFAVVLTLSVFIPGLGFSHGGATRWIALFGISFQPAELLKLATIVFLTAWFAKHKNKVGTLEYGFLPVAAVLSIVAGILVVQPDTGTFIVIAVASILTYFLAGAQWRHIGILALIGLVLLGTLAFTRPYVRDRLMTYLDPSRDIQGASWQLQQSLIAIGSGGVFGKGFGQSLQKFQYLPEPIGDSIFAVAGEEFGFVGSTIIIALFMAFLLRGLVIARNAPDVFSRLLVAGLVILIVVQAFVNIGSMIGAFPLTGIPLIFLSHGGTALFLALVEVGIILQVSRYTGLGTR